MTGPLTEQELARKVRIALAVREAMREHRKGKPIAFSWSQRP